MLGGEWGFRKEFVSRGAVKIGISVEKDTLTKPKF